jgi:hypothetical protein
MKIKFMLIALLLSLLAACSGSAPESSLSDQDAINTIVAATLQANGTAQAAEADVAEEEAPIVEDAAPVASTGSIAGSLSFPSEVIPALTVVAYQQGSQNWFAARTVEHQGDFQIDNVPPGQYTVVAYAFDADFGGGYSQAVPCGLSVDCNDHSLITVEVTAGQTTSDVDPTDWYAPEGTFPSNPNVVSADENDVVDGFGSIAGSLSYPSSAIPAMQVTAFNANTGFWWYVLTVDNQSSYQIDDLPNGDYYVVAYPVGDLEGAAYSAAVPCGLDATCTDHSILSVEVKADEVTEDVNPGDWYAGSGAFPENPAP